MLDKPADLPALIFLDQSGARAISVFVCFDGSYGVSVSFYQSPGTAVFWLPGDKAVKVSRLARKIAGDSPSFDTMVAALQKAATECRVVLTEHVTAISRATAMAAKLDALMDQLQASGVMLEFTRTYKARRLAAKARGQGFMRYSVAQERLRRALIPLLVNGGQIESSIFREVFAPRRPTTSKRPAGEAQSYATDDLIDEPA
jgi:hypothetical protein